MVPQPVVKPNTRFAIFLVLTIRRDADGPLAVRGVCQDLAALVRAVGARDLAGQLSCVVAVGSEAWDGVFGAPRPAQLHPFRPLTVGGRNAPATAGDVLLHIRAERFDLCFELARQIMKRLGKAVTVEDETHGFRYFDDRDLTGFVDGTENPTGQGAVEAALVGAEDPLFAGGSYVMVQKYIHRLDAWDALSAEVQEGIIGRTKLSDIELPDEVKPTYAHNALTSIEEAGQAVEILRHNMPFGDVARGESGTYFIGYARAPRPLELMLSNMFVGRPPGNYDRLLDFTSAVTGSAFFAPAGSFLEGAQ
ncbi:MAG: Dyp-type peroxidase [Candidatus Limnocylindrales bacterium]